MWDAGIKDPSSPQRKSVVGQVCPYSIKERDDWGDNEHPPTGIIYSNKCVLFGIQERGIIRFHFLCVLTTYPLNPPIHPTLNNLLTSLCVHLTVRGDTLIAVTLSPVIVNLKSHVSYPLPNSVIVSLYSRRVAIFFP